MLRTKVKIKFLPEMKNQNPRTQDPEILRIQRMGRPEIEDPALDDGNRSGF